MNESIYDFLTELALAGLNGDCLRIACFVAGSGKQCRLSEIQTALDLHKSHASFYCKKLYEMGIFKRFTLVQEVDGHKHTFPMYSVNWNYNKSNKRGIHNETIQS